MLVNNYSVRIPEGIEDGGQYVVLAHKTQYTIVLRNNHPVRCDAYLEIDGKHQGTWRIKPQSTFSIDRPGHDKGKFTFYKLGSKEGNQVGLSEDDPNLGLIKVVFTPEKERPPTKVISEPETYFSSSPQLYSYGVQKRQQPSRSFSAGGTGLSGESSQDFVEAEKMDLEYSKSTTIHLRLVASDVNEPRPLTTYSNPVPPPVH